MTAKYEYGNTKFCVNTEKNMVVGCRVTASRKYRYIAAQVTRRRTQQNETGNCEE